jgi:isopentenyldiphosphate isomerase
MFDIYPPPSLPELHNAILSLDKSSSLIPTGVVKERGQVHKDGDWHRSIHAWVAQKMIKTNSNNNSHDDNGTTTTTVSVLLQRRSPYKDTHPNLLDVSCAGHVNSGSNIYDSTKRELEEELGGKGNMIHYTIDNIKECHLFTIATENIGSTSKFGNYVDCEYADIFLFWYNNNDSIMTTELFAPLVPEEVSGFELMDASELIRKLRLKDENLVPRSLAYIDALEKALLFSE